VFQKSFEECLAKLDIAMAEMGLEGGTNKLMSCPQQSPPTTPTTPQSIPEPPTPELYDYNRGAAVNNQDISNIPSTSTDYCKKRLTYVSSN
jgi:hypothetical protein